MLVKTYFCIGFLKKMHKYFFTYLLALVLISSVVIPACLNLMETSYELSIEVDAEEESEKTKDVEIKMFTTSFEYTTQEPFLCKNGIIYFTKKYTSVFLKLDSPPPKEIS